MTILAGAYSRRTGDPLPDALCDGLQRSLSRHPGERYERFRDDRCFLVKADTGAFGDPAFRVDSDAVSFLVGEPLVSRGDRTYRRRSQDLEELHDAWRRDDWDTLTAVRGVFAAAHYRRDSGTLVLLTDKLGIRPMFYWLGDRYVVFATALRILEQIAEIDKVMDVRAVTEVSSLGFPLSDRTPYAALSLLMPAEIIEVTGATSVRRRYWRWDDIAPSSEPVDELAKEAYRVFTDAVALRSGADTATVAFLSGGLDSRAIVTALRARDMHVHTFNFALEGSQDQIFGAEFAKRAGVTHAEAPMQVGQPAWSMMMAKAWSSSPHRSTAAPERPGLIWSGDGGSVVLGHVYLKQDMVDVARRDPAAAAGVMQDRWSVGVLSGLLQPDVVAALAGIGRRDWAEELSGFKGVDPGRNLHLILLQNDQRRHLAEHFEGIDLHRLEFQLPFFDSDFVASVLRVPVDECLGHAFYMRWLRLFPDVIMSVPWQAYPGHVPCPLPVPAGLTTQWVSAPLDAITKARRSALLADASAMLHATEFPHRVMRRSYLRFATWVHRLGLRDLGYVINAARLYHRYWLSCGGKLALPVAEGAHRAQ